MKISVIEPITPAWNHMVRILFKPFDFKKWLALGFCAFLATCGEQGGGSGNTWSNQASSTQFEEAKTWVEANLTLLITWVVIAFTVMLLLWLFITWISSRGKFMLLDGVIKNRGAIKEPWSEYKTEGNSLFLFSIMVGLLSLLCFIIIVGSSVFMALPDIQSKSFGSAGMTAIVVGGSMFFVYILASIAVVFFIRVFLVPTMYLKRVKAIEGFKLAWSGLCRGHIGSAVLLLLMMMALGIGAGVVAFIAICSTCCIGALPYISSVLLLPITVFFTCYILMYIQQFGDDWTFFSPMCPSCSYDLQGLNRGHKCPECGRSLD